MKKALNIFLAIILVFEAVMLTSCGNEPIHSWRHVDKIVDAMEAEDYETFDKLLENTKYSVDGYSQSFITRLFIGELIPLQYTALETACHAENYYFVEKLIEKGANTNFSSSPNYWSPIYFAVCGLYSEPGKENAYKITKLLLEKGADPNFVDEYKRSSLLYVAWFNNETEYGYKMAELLLEYGADKYSTDIHGMIPYDYAIKSGNYKLAELLKP